MAQRRFDLDALRGLMLVLMTLTHLPTRWSDPAGQPLGYVSAAEGFVMLSAYMAGMVYAGRGLKEGIPAMRSAFLQRALKIYVCQAALLIFLFTFITLFGLTVDKGEVRGLVSYYLRDPVTALWGSLLLIHNPPLLDILPLYIVFMLVSPWVLAHGLSRGWGGILAVSTGLWALAQFDLGEHVYLLMVDLTGLPIPLKETGAFEMYGWQFLWILGLYMGAGAARKEPAPVDVRPHVASLLPPKGAATVLGRPGDSWPRALVGFALVYAAVMLVWRHVVGQVPFHEGFDPTGTLNLLFDKWHLGPLRLVNFIALLVLAMHFGPALMARLPRMRYLEVMGSASLPVFCAHLVLVLIALLVWGAPKPDRPLLADTVILVGSFVLLYVVALISQRLDEQAAAFKARRAAERETRQPRPASEAGSPREVPR